MTLTPVEQYSAVFLIFSIKVIGDPVCFLYKYCSYKILSIIELVYVVVTTVEAMGTRIFSYMDQEIVYVIILVIAVLDRCGKIYTEKAAAILNWMGFSYWTQ